MKTLLVVKEHNNFPLSTSCQRQHGKLDRPLAQLSQPPPLSLVFHFKVSDSFPSHIWRMWECGLRYLPQLLTRHFN